MPKGGLVARDAPSACELLRQIHAGETTCLATVTALLDRIALCENHIEACVEVANRDTVREKAATVDAKIAAGEALRPLEGLPIIVKANVDTKGMLTSACTAALGTHVPATDAPAWAALDAAGAILIAKTNMPELASAVCGYNPVIGHCRNPYAPDFTTGGSSSGTAAGIAAGYAPCGMGSDTAGSLRFPAEVCGIAGMRPSLGRYPTAGCVPLMRVDTPGPMARTVADLALLDAVMAGEEGVLGAPPAAADLNGMKVCMPKCMTGEVAPGTQAALDAAAAALKAAGCVIVDDETDGGLFSKMYEAIEGAETLMSKGPQTMRRLMDAYLAHHREHTPGFNVTTDDVAAKLHKTSLIIKLGLTSPDAKEWSDLDSDAFDAKMADHRAEVAKLEAAVSEYFAESGCCAFLTPATFRAPHAYSGGEESSEALEAAFEKALDGGDMRAAIGANMALKRMTGYSRTGGFCCDLPVPSVTVPTPARHRVVDGAGEEAETPAGVMLFGPPRADRFLLQVGMALENALKPPA